MNLHERVDERWLQYDTIRYDTMHYIYVRPKANVPHGTKQKRVIKKLKTKNRDAQKKGSSRKVRGVSPEAGRDSMMEKICERGRS